MKCSSAAVLSSSGSSKRPIRASNSFGQWAMYAGWNRAGPVGNEISTENDRIQWKVFQKSLKH